jgi:hypothetical protein
MKQKGIKKFRVTLTVHKEITRTVSAYSEEHAKMILSRVIIERGINVYGFDLAKYDAHIYEII